MRYLAAEKFEIIRIVGQSHLSTKHTLDRPFRPSQVWNRIGAEVQAQIIDMALEHSELSPCELAVRAGRQTRQNCPGGGG